MLSYLHIWLFILLIKKYQRFCHENAGIYRYNVQDGNIIFVMALSWQLYHMSKTAKQHLNFMMMVMVIFNFQCDITYQVSPSAWYHVINSNSHKSLKVYCKFIIHFDTASVALLLACSPQVWQILGKSLTHIFYALESYSFHTCWMAGNHVNLIIRGNMCF